MDVKERTQGVSGGFDGIARRDADRVIWEAKLQKRQDVKNSRSRKRGFGRGARQEQDDDQ